MFARYALCLTPAILAFVVAALVASNRLPGFLSPDAGFTIVCVLVGLGAAYCGFAVARKVYRSIEDPGPARVILTILTFIGVVLGYIVLSFAGCCGSLLVGESFSS